MYQHQNLMQKWHKSAMESRDHLKNGASPKSQMSRKNLILFSISLIIACIVSAIFTSCGDEEKGSNNKKNSTSVFTSLEINIGRTVFGRCDELRGQVNYNESPVIAEGAVSNSKSIISVTKKST